MSSVVVDEDMKWRDKVAVYPPFHEIVTALQDVGKAETAKKKGKDVPRHKYPLIEKLASKIFVSIQREFNKPEGLTKNVSRGKVPLYKEIILARKHVDVSETAVVFHSYAKDGKVFLVQKNPVNAGLDICIDRFQNHVLSQLRQKNSARTASDGLRLALILLDGQYRSTVVGLMSRKKDRKMSDVTGDPILHFYELILNDCFLNRDYHIDLPAEYNDFPEDEKGTWDPITVSASLNMREQPNGLRRLGRSMSSLNTRKPLIVGIRILEVGMEHLCRLLTTVLEIGG
jgi:hypothetical protein